MSRDEQLIYETTVSAWDHDEWEAHGLKEYGDFCECVEHCNQYNDGPDSTAGTWYYDDNQALVIYHGTWANDHSPGCDSSSYATVYPSIDMFETALKWWKSQPEWLEEN